jgi:hypothetical protein
VLRALYGDELETSNAGQLEDILKVINTLMIHEYR